MKFAEPGVLQGSVLGPILYLIYTRLFFKYFVIDKIKYNILITTNINFLTKFNYPINFGILCIPQKVNYVTQYTTNYKRWVKVFFLFTVRKIQEITLSGYIY